MCVSYRANREEYQHKSDIFLLPLAEEYLHSNSLVFGNTLRTHEFIEPGKIQVVQAHTRLWAEVRLNLTEIIKIEKPFTEYLNYKKLNNNTQKDKLQIHIFFLLSIETVAIGNHF